jgi:hypothetical protein
MKDLTSEQICAAQNEQPATDEPKLSIENHFTHFMFKKWKTVKLVQRLFINGPRVFDEDV